MKGDVSYSYEFQKIFTCYNKNADVSERREDEIEENQEDSLCMCVALSHKYPNSIQFVCSEEEENETLVKKKKENLHTINISMSCETVK